MKRVCLLEFELHHLNEISIRVIRRSYESYKTTGPPMLLPVQPSGGHGIQFPYRTDCKGLFLQTRLRHSSVLSILSATILRARSSEGQSILQYREFCRAHWKSVKFFSRNKLIARPTVVSPKTSNAAFAKKCGLRQRWIVPWLFFWFCPSCSKRDAESEAETLMYGL
jgi:hypothetical protein